MSSVMLELRQRITAAITREKLLPRQAPLLIALSGGRDSVALARILTDLQPWGEWRLQAVHFDHGLRGEAAAQADRDLCSELCQRLKVPLTVERLQIERAPGVSLETAGRNARLAALRRLAPQLRTPIVVTAHHADDRVETMLFRMLRGTGLRGLGGIAWRRSERLEDAPATTGAGFGLLQFHRPLLAIWREEITEYCRAAGLRWNDDPTNASEAHDRNRIRRSLLPKLAQDFNPEVRRHLWDLAEDAARWAQTESARSPTDADADCDAPDDAYAAALEAVVPAGGGADGGADAGISPPSPAPAELATPASADWPWPQPPITLDGATLMALGRQRAVQALQTVLEIARRRAGVSGAPDRRHYTTLWAMLTDPAAAAVVDLPTGFRVRRAGTPPHARLVIDPPAENP